MHNGERSAKLDVLEDLIKYMRKLELAKDDVADPLSEGINSIEDKMHDREERGMEEEGPEVEIEISKSPEGEEESLSDVDEGGEEMAEELSPFQKKMKDYFNDTDRPKVSNSMSFMVASKKPMKGEDMDMPMVAMKKKKRGRPFKR